MIDLSDLSDDQLIELARALFAEVGRRASDVHAAAQEVALDEAEKLRIAERVAELEAAAARHAERERVAAEAREQAQARARSASSDADAQLQRALKREAARREWISRTAALVGKPPRAITICRVATSYGDRVLINEGDRYSLEHLVDYNVTSSAIKTARSLVPNKPELIRLCVEFAAAHSIGAVIAGSDHA